MDIREYIASGILETYAMGAATSQERQEVECMSHIYPEIAEELKNVETALEKYAESIAKTPPSDLKGKILAEIANTAQESPLAAINSSETNVIQMVPSKLGMVASTLAILFLTVFALWQATDRRSKNEAIAELNKETSTQIAAIKSLENKLELNKLERSFLISPQTDKVVLAGTDFSKDSKVDLFWNKTQLKYTLVAQNLPKASPGKQYQIWAISNGTPISIGLLNKQNSLAGLQALSTSSIQTFAITLENEGGVAQPSLDKMMVAGNTAG
jgi:hypothetical protein